MHKVCGKAIYSEPSSFCEHIVFVYAQDFEGIWVYKNEIATERFGGHAEVEAEYLIEVCWANNWKLVIYENLKNSTYGLPTLYVCALTQND